MQVHHGNSVRPQAPQAGSGRYRGGGDKFANELEAGMAKVNKTCVSGGKERIRLGTISDHNPTVSHLLVQKPDYAQECWDIVHSARNRDKPYTRMPAGTEVYLDVETREIMWTGDTQEPVSDLRSGDSQESEMQRIEASIHRAATVHNLSRRLIAGVIRAESAFNTTAVSEAGAQGLMQLMPETARELGVKDPFDIGENIDAGVRYLKKMLNLFGGNLEKALAAYNAGPGAVKRFGGEVPYPETRKYVARVLSFLE